MMTSPSASNAGTTHGPNYSEFQVSLLNLAFQGALAPSLASELESNTAKPQAPAATRT
ncbi:MAG: hypothetical protein ABL995_07675 [Bryobacteraceae bacterium]